jgi:hypothetical protein
VGVEEVDRPIIFKTKLLRNKTYASRLNNLCVRETMKWRIIFSCEVKC